MCLTLAQADVPAHAHIHLDVENALEAGSLELIRAKDGCRLA